MTPTTTAMPSATISPVGFMGLNLDGPAVSPTPNAIKSRAGQKRYNRGYERHSHNRLLVRIRLHLFLSGRHAHRRPSASKRRAGPLAALPARSDLQSAGLGQFAVQHLPRQRSLQVARSRPNLRPARPAVHSAGAVSAKYGTRRPRRADRARAALG